MATRHPLLGVGLCLLAAGSFACNTALASVAYKTGAVALSVLTYRTGVALIALFVLLKLWRVPIALPPAKRWAALGLGVMLGAYSYGLLGAVERIPVALAVLTFYAYPLLLGLASWGLGRERMTPRLAGALAVAFIGLALALNIQGGLNVVGFGLAAGGAILFTILVLVNNSMVGTADSRPVSLHMLFTAFLTYFIADLFAGRYPLPQTSMGWAAFLAVGAFYSFSIISLFIAVSWIGSVRTSLFMNFEPVSSVFLGTVVLGQPMRLSQLAGAALVIAAILFTAWGRVGAVQPARAS